MRRLLEGGVYFLSKVTHSKYYRNKLTTLLKSNNFDPERTLINKLLIDEVVYMLFILGKTLGQTKKYVCFRLPSVPKFRSPTLSFLLSFLGFYN